MGLPMNEETLFHQALSKPQGEREDFLAGACAGKPELRAAVEALLAAHEASGAFLATPADAGAAIDSDAGLPGTEATGVHTPIPDVEPAPPSITADYQDAVKPNALIAGRYTLQERSAKAAWAKSGSPSSPNRSSARWR